MNDCSFPSVAFLGNEIRGERVESHVAAVRADDRIDAGVVGLFAVVGDGYSSRPFRLPVVHEDVDDAVGITGYQIWMPTIRRRRSGRLR